MNVHLAIELVSTGQCHEEVDDEEVVVDGADLSGVSAPEEAGGEDGELLVDGDVFGWPLHVLDVGEGDGPLEGGRPKENGEWASRVCKQRLHRGGKRRGEQGRLQCRHKAYGHLIELFSY